MYKLGSLFDGIGGFPLSAVMCGVEPVWASEIEPFPILTTYKRFPNMKHLGSVTEISGAEIDPVDIVTFGSPCQDLSVAGKQAGIHEGERSNLFFEAVRIIKEMRANDKAAGRPDELCRPRFAVWENVPGAFSSNKGADFQAVLQALAEVCDPDVSVPLPEKGKWLKAGFLLGDGYSISWRTYDAQFWGVPQRRKRIYLVADFGGTRANEILFDPESLHGNLAEGRTPWQRAAGNAQGSAGRGCAAGFVGRQGAQSGSVAFELERSPTLRSCITSDTVISLEGNTIDRASNKNGKGYCENVIPTLNTVDRHGVAYPDVAKTLTARHDSSPCVDRGQNVVALDCRNLCGSPELSATLQAKSGGGHSLNYQNPVVYDCRGNGEGDTAPTLTGDHQNRVTDYTGIAVQGFDMQAFGKYSECGTSSTLKQRDYKDATDLVVERGRRYIVRRLTPLECCRLQGFPDGWTENLGIPDPTDEELSFFTKVWADWSAINGTKPKTTAWVRKWLADPQSDSAEYKAYGHSLAIPCAYDVIRRVVQAYDGE